MPGTPQTLPVPPPVSVPTLLNAIRLAAGNTTPDSFASITGAPTDNTALAAALAAKANLPTATTLTYASSVALDFSGADFQTVTLTGVITFTTSNLAAGRSKTIRIIGDGSSRALTFPVGWTFVGAAAPTALAANKTAILTMTSFSTTDANVVAAYSAQP